MTELALFWITVHGGEAAGFEALVRRYERQVLVTSLRLLGNLADAQDASQEVFLRLYRNRKRVEDPEQCSAWLYRVTVNVCHDLRRRRTLVTPLDEAADVAGTGAGPLEQLTLAERQRALEIVLRRLPEKERAALVLRDLEGLATSEVAAILGSSEATVRSQVRQARLRIRESVERFFGRRAGSGEKP